MSVHDSTVFWPTAVVESCCVRCWTVGSTSTRGLDSATPAGATWCWTCALTTGCEDLGVETTANIRSSFALLLLSGAEADILLLLSAGAINVLRSTPETIWCIHNDDRHDDDDDDDNNLVHYIAPPRQKDFRGAKRHCLGFKNKKIVTPCSRLSCCASSLLWMI